MMTGRTGEPPDDAHSRSSLGRIAHPWYPVQYGVRRRPHQTQPNRTRDPLIMVPGGTKTVLPSMVRMAQDPAGYDARYPSL